MMAANPEQFNIRWNNYTTVIQSVFRKMLSDERYVDVTLACEGGSIKCHRIVLSACSPYFANLLLQYPEDRHVVIFMRDTKHWTLKHLVHFMYHGELSIKQVQLQQLIRVAESLQIRGLSETEAYDSDVERLTDEGEQDEEDIRVNTQTQPRRPNPNNNNRVQGLRPQLPELGRLPQPLQQQRSQPIARGPIVNTQGAKKRPLPTPGSAQANGPPKLTKMQKVDEIQTNGTPMASSSNNKQIQGKSLLAKTKSPPPALDKFVDASGSADDWDAESEDERPRILHSSANCEPELYEPYGPGNNTDNSSHVTTHHSYNPVEEGSDEETEENLPVPIGRYGELGWSFKLRQRAKTSSNKYPLEVRESVLSNLRAGKTIKECTEMFGVPRKTISKWKSRELQGIIKNAKDNNEGEPQEEVELENEGEILYPEFPLGPVVDATDRQDRLKKATDLALSGTTVRQAAGLYGIPRTTLCAYMKRQGITGKRPPLPATLSPTYQSPNSQQAAVRRRSQANSRGASSSNNVDFPLFGLSDVMNGLEYEDMEEGEEEEQDVQYQDDGEETDVKSEYDSN